MSGKKKLIINTGQRFGRLVIVKETRLDTKRRYFLCKCDCGSKKEVRMDSLTGGAVVSCGCYNREASSKANSRHGQYKSRLYSIWRSMRGRCQNKNNTSFGRYGGRGIDVCPEWDDFSIFNRWALSNGYEKHLTIERINNDIGYSPENCAWITMDEQKRNTSRCQKILINGEKKTLRQWAKSRGVHISTLLYRIKKNKWSIEKALSVPVGRYQDA